VAIAALVVSYVARLDAALREVARILRPAGVLVMSDLHPVAVDRGWRRSFAGGSGERVEARAAPYTVERLVGGIEAAGLTVDVQREPVIGSSLEPHFRAAGRQDFESLRGTPLLVLLRARKGGTLER